MISDFRAGGSTDILARLMGQWLSERLPFTIENRPCPGSAAEFGKLIADETEKYGKVIGAANIKPE